MTDFRDNTLRPGDELRPRNPDPRLSDPDLLDSAGLPPASRSFGATWGWIVGAVVLAIIIAFAFSSGEGPRVATPANSPPVTTDGSATPRTLPSTPGTPRTTTGSTMAPTNPAPAPSTSSPAQPAQ